MRIAFALASFIAALFSLSSGPFAISAVSEATEQGTALAKRTTLTAKDFTYLGYYDVQTNGENTTYAQGLTHRYVDGDLRFLNFQHGGYLDEFSIAGTEFGGIITATTNRWRGIGGMRDFKGFWWDEAKKRLWSTSTIDYTAAYSGVQLFTRTLNPDGTISSLRGPIGLSGVPQKRVFGGAQAVPLWFQKEFGVGPYVVGWGGYTSLVAQGGGAALGPTMYAIPDPAGYPDSSEIPTGVYRVLMDTSAATFRGDWYGSGSPNSYDRGVRLTHPINYFDGGDPRPNPPTPPTVPPSANAKWLSPAPDGYGRFVWGDEYWNTGAWIDGQLKHGFVLIASLGCGKVWYAKSTLNFDRRCFELHIFDPNDLGEAARGSRDAWNVRPTMSILELPGLGDGGPMPTGNHPSGEIGGATYDPATKRLYLIGFGVNTFFSRLYVFAVNA